MTGYSHTDYAASLGEFGTPILLPHSRGWLLERPIAQTNYHDAMGCYPLFACEDWSQLQVDLESLQRPLVSIAIVADPFGQHDPDYLRKCFSDVVVPFKQHLVIDLSRAPELESFMDPHHRRNARQALARIDIEQCAAPTLLVDEWNSLYANLVKRHGISGLTAFSLESFRKQMAVPGIVAFRATANGEIVGMTLWYTDRGIAYYHLGAYSDAGYQLRASFAMFWKVIEYFAAQGLQWINLGAGAGTANTNKEDGLSRFKRGWSTGTRTAYFCGRVLDHQTYAEIMRASGAVNGTGYFPAYRKGEFG